MAGRLARELGALAVKNLTEPGMHFVGGVTGLALVVKPSGTRSWVLRVAVGGKRSHIGLGGYPDTTLAQAQERARKVKDQIRDGIDPLDEKRRRKTEVVWTFDRCADEYIKLHRPSWKNSKHGDQWINTLKTYVSPVFGDRNVRDITVGDVLGAIEPIWLAKNETAVRVQQRIELVLGWAASRGYRSKENPAQWRGNLQHTLPKPSKVNQRQHHKALPHSQANELWKRLQAVDGMSAKSLQWVILTACRSGEARGATWGEIDIERHLWTVPAARMKSSREHRVPLSDAAIELLESLPRFEPAEGQPDYVFPGRTGGQLSDMSLTAVLRRLKVDAVPHGLRSTFADWSAETTTYPQEIREMALAHSVGDATVQAYTRTDLIERRRQLMDDWARHVTTPATSASVVSIRKAGK
jgi:integrase